MKQYATLILATTLFCVGCSLTQQPTGKKLPRTASLPTTSYEEPLSCYLEDEPFSGVVERYYDGAVAYVQNGHQHGDLNQTRNMYANDKQLAIESICVNGRLSGVTRIYYPNGNLKKEMKYAKGQLHGDSAEYYPDGKVRTVTHYTEGKREGAHSFYHEKGYLIIQVDYQDNTPVSGFCYNSRNEIVHLTTAEIYNYLQGTGLICQ